MTINHLSEAEIIDAQNKWANAIVDIGNTYSSGGDVQQLTEKYLHELYTFEKGVLFKPTLASEQQFRHTFDDALSYFIGGKIKEDSGFALKPWSKIRFGEQKMIILHDFAIAMGNYYFTEEDQTSELKVEYTFGYVKDTTGKIRISLHHSSLPYSQD